MVEGRSSVCHFGLSTECFSPTLPPYFKPLETTRDCHACGHKPSYDCSIVICRVPVPAVQALAWRCHVSSLARDLVASLARLVLFSSDVHGREEVRLIPAGLFGCCRTLGAEASFAGQAARGRSQGSARRERSSSSGSCNSW